MGWTHRLTPIVNRGLDYKKQLPMRTAYDIEQAVEDLPGFGVYH